MYIFTEKRTSLDALDLIMQESTTTSSSTYIFLENIYPKVEKVLSTPDGRKKFTRIVEEYINRNSSKLTTIGPLYLIPFTHDDQKKYFDLFGVSKEDIVKCVKEVTSKVNDKANWLLIKNNPIFTLLYYIIRYFTITRDDKGLKSALAITALAFYPSMWDKYYKFPPDSGIMQYTIDNLSQRFIIKKSNSIFNTLVYSIQNSWSFHEKNIIDGSDGNCIKFIQRIRNDQNSLMKKIKNNYMENYAKGLRVTTSVDQYDDAIVVDNENDTNRVEQMTNKIVLQILINGIDLKFCDFASNAAGISRMELRNYITKIIIEKRSDEMKQFIESILFIYLYDDKHTFEQINSTEFISFALVLFKKTNSKNPNITNIKQTLDKWGTDTGIYGKFNRLATRVDYTKAIFLYFIMCIQKYN
jgi:hypothetical protein